MAAKEEFQKIFEKTTKNVFAVYEIFKNYYGEENVDLQGINTFDTFWKTNKDNKMLIFTYSSQVENVANESLESISPEHLKYFCIADKIRNLYNPEIIVRWNKVTVTNENNKSVDITELYCKTELTIYGNIKTTPHFNRTEYTEIQWMSDYMHSHICGINTNSTAELKKWRDSCLGDGPIRGTICTLTNTCDFNYWYLYCLELDKYVHVESLTGVPYRCLEQIGMNNYTMSVSYIFNNVITNEIMSRSWKLPQFREVIDETTFNYFFKDFIKNNTFKFSYAGYWNITTPFNTFAIILSNYFIDWINTNVRDKKFNLNVSKNEFLTRLLNRKVLLKGIWSDNKLYTNRNSDRIHSMNSYEGTEILKFKKEWKKLHIIKNTDIETERNEIMLLDPSIVLQVYVNIFKILNNNEQKFK